MSRFLAFLFMFSMLYAQDITEIDLHGRVVNEIGIGMSQVVISIKGLNYTSVTDSQGNWSIQVSPQNSVKPNRIKQNFALSGIRNVLHLHLLSSDKVRIDVMNIFGKSVKVIANESMLQGHHQFDLSEYAVAKGVWIIRVQSSLGVQTMRWIHSEQGMLSPSNRDHSYTTGSILKRETNEPDSLILEYLNREVARVELSSLVIEELPDFVICQVSPIIMPENAATIIDSLPLYVLFGRSARVSVLYDESLWRLSRVLLGSSSYEASGAIVDFQLEHAGDSVKIQFIDKEQQITFPNLEAQTYGSGPYVIPLLASSNLPVTVIVNSDSVCSNTGDTIQFLSAGVCEFTAFQEGDDFFNYVEIDSSFVIERGLQVITIDSIEDHTYGDAIFPVLARSNMGFGVTLQSLTPSICSVNQYLVSLDSAGTCTIQANQAGNLNYSAATASRSFTVHKSNQTIQFDPVGLKTNGDSAFVVNAVASSGLVPILSSATSSVCTITNNWVTIINGGDCIIRAWQMGNGKYNSAVVDDTISIAKAEQQVVIDPIDDKTYGDASFTVTASASTGLVVTVNSLTPTVCSVVYHALTQFNIVTLLSGGVCTLVGEQSGNQGYNSALSLPKSFNVAKLSQTITLPTWIDRTYGVAPFTISATASSGLAVSFSSFDPEVCVVNQNTVTVLSAGICPIQAEQVGDSRYSSATAMGQFTISKATQTLIFTAPTTRLYGSTDTLLNATSSVALPTIIQSLTPAVCNVQEKSVIIVGVGTCTLEARASGNANYLDATPVVRSIIVSKGNQSISFTPVTPIQYGSQTQFDAQATASSGDAVTFTSGSLSVCSVSGNAFTILSAGTCIVRATQAGGSLFNSITSDLNVTITKADQEITFTPMEAQVYSGSTFSISGFATSSSGLTLTYSSLSPTICTVSGLNVTKLRSGDCIIAANQSGNGNYSAAPQATQAIVIEKANQSITFNALPDRVFGVSPFTISATASSGMAVSFSSVTPSVCTVSGNTVTLIATGICDIMAEQVGDDRYNTAPPVYQNFNVN